MEKQINYINPKMATEEEKKLLQVLENARQSEELKLIMSEIKHLATQATNISIYAQRIKRPESLLRTIRVKGTENACDLIGVLFVVDNNEDIYRIVDTICNIIKNVEHYDLSNSLGVPPYKVVPLCYTILSELYLKDVDTLVPFEIRIHDKEGILATESNYYLYKKDGISSVKERFELSGKTLELIKMRASIDSSKLINKIDIAKKEQDIRKKILESKDLFSRYSEEIYGVFKEYAKNLFKYNNRIKVGHFDFLQGYSLSEEDLTYLDETLSKIFDSYYEDATAGLENKKIINMYDRCVQAILKINLLTFDDVDCIDKRKILKR